MIEKGIVLIIHRRKKAQICNRNVSDESNGELKQPYPISSDIESNLQYIKEQVGMNSDLAFRQVPLTAAGHDTACLVFFKSSIDDDSMNIKIIMPLSQPLEKLDNESILKLLPISQIEETKDLNSSIKEIFKGKVLLLIQNSEYGYLLPVINRQKRSIEEPINEKTIRGGREGFVEDIDTNIFMIRRRLPDPKLEAEEFTVGVRTKTRVAVLHIRDIANEKILEELKKRIKKIDIDGITDSGMLEQFIEDNPISVFPQIKGTERPDKVVYGLLEGRICVICDATPVVLVVPVVFSNFLTAPDDYYERTLVGSFNRFLSYIAVFVTITLPSLYLSLTSFHPELIPFNLLIPLAESRKELPFPPLIEVILLEVGVEFLREMGLRMPEPVGRSLGVVGGIVLGDAAIRANLVSPGMVIIVGVTAIISFTVINYSMVLSLRLVRFFIVFMTAMFGAYGVTIGLLLVLGHLIRLESFSIPYLGPFAPVRQDDIKDTFFRTFLWKMKYRPEYLHVKDRKRQNNNKRRDSDDDPS